MGYMRRHAIIVTSFDDKDIEKAYAKAVEIFGRTAALSDDGVISWKGEFGAQMVSSIVQGTMNADRSFFVGPDGSKEGWVHSDEGDKRRAEFIAWMRAEANASNGANLYWVEVFYGDDEGAAEVVNHCSSMDDE